MGTVNTNYVVKAETNTTLSGLTNSRIFDNGTNVGIGTTSPSNILEARGAYSDSVGAIVQTGSGSCIIAEYVGGATPVPFAIRGSNTGADTADTFGILHIDRNGSGVGGGSNLHFRRQNSSGDWKEYAGLGGIIANSTAGSEAGHLDFYTTNSGSTRQRRMRITSTGNVGIGTSSPDSKLHVSGAGTQAIKITAGTNSSASLRLANDAHDWDVNCQTNDNFAIYSHTDSIERLVIRPTTGNVGIGTTSPSYKLDISGGGIKLDGKSELSDNAFFVGSPNFGFRWNSNDNQFNNVVMYDNGDMYVRGNMGLETTSPETKLHISTTSAAVDLVKIENGTQNLNLGVNNSSGGSYVFENGNNALRFGTNNAERMRIDSSGRVGIGTQSPSYKLEINGTVFSAGSSIDYKENIQEYKTKTDVLMQLRPVKYDYKDDFSHLGKRLVSDYQIGLIAEEVAKVAPELAVTKMEDDNEVVRNVDYEKLSVFLLSEVQKLRSELDELKGTQ